MTALLRRVPFIEQASQYECGWACLAMILGYYGQAVEPSQLYLERGGLSRNGSSLRDLKQVAEDHQLVCQGLRISGERLGMDRPLIVHWNKDHFVVLERLSGGYAHVVDPARGRLKVPEAEFYQLASLALLAVPGEGFERRQASGVWRDYWALIRPSGLILGLILASSVWLQALALATPMLLQYIIDDVVSARVFGAGTALTALIAVCSALYMALYIARSFALAHVQKQLDQRLMEGFTQRLVRLPLEVFDRSPTGDLIVRANSNVIIREVLSTRVTGAFLDAGMLLMFLVYMFAKSPGVGWVVLVLGALQVSFRLVIQPAIADRVRKELTFQSAASSHLTELIKGMAKVKSLGLESTFLQRWRTEFHQQLDAALQKGRFLGVTDAVQQGLRYFTPLLIGVMLIPAIQEKQLSLGSAVALFTIANAFMLPLTSLATALGTLTVGNTYMKRLLSVIRQPAEQPPALPALPKLTGEITLRNIDFAYDRAEPILKAFNLHVKAGEFLVIVGASGSGKSTLASLILGTRQPDSGQVLVDGWPIQKHQFTSLRSQIGSFNQHTHLFSCSVAENITLGRNIPIEQVMAVCHFSGIHEYISGLPMGYQTLLSEDGLNFSGGQRQRLALARALLAQPAVLILDEAVSNIDLNSESEIFERLAKLSCTRIVITHRLDLVRYASRVVVLQGGQVVEDGAPDTVSLSRPFHAMRSASFPSRA